MHTLPSSYENRVSHKYVSASTTRKSSLIIIEYQNVRILGVLAQVRRWIRESGDEEQNQFVRMLYISKFER